VEGAEGRRDRNERAAARNRARVWRLRKAGAGLPPGQSHEVKGRCQLYSGLLVLGQASAVWGHVGDVLVWLAPASVAIVVLWLFLRDFFPLKNRSSEILSELRSTTAFLEGFGRDEALSRYSEIEQFFNGTMGVLKHHWVEFSESCVRSNPSGHQVVVHNTIDAAHFFPADDIVDSELETEVTRQAPGIFTAAGIVGTFFGISIGLIRAVMLLGSDGPDAALRVTEATTSLLWHVGPAFGASFIAVLLAVIFQYIERHKVSEVRQALLRFQRELDRLFPRKTAESILLAMAEEDARQTQSLQKLSLDFATQMEPLIQRIVENQSQKMDQTNQALVANMVAQIHSKLQPMTEAIGSATRELKAEQSQLAVGAIDTLVQQLSGALTSSARNQVTQLAETLQSLTAGLQTQRTQMEEFMGRIGTVSQRQATLLEAQVARLSTASDSAVNAAQQTMSAVANLLKPLEDHAGEMRQQVQAHREIAGRLAEVCQSLEGVARIFQSQGLAAQKATTSLVEACQNLEEQNASADDRIAALGELQGELARLANRLAEGIGRQNEAISQITAGFEGMKGSAENYFGAVIPGLQKALGEFDTHLTRGTDMLGSAVSRMAEPCDDIAGILEDLRNRLGGK